ncbi:MAG TPA: DUF885 domain-containing protein, partial [Gemmatimonadales bacterium]|nr:DUF885 domain-containing protein [Gemmatimonadales bacterium]
VDEFIESYFQANPHVAVYQGRHEFDGRFPEWSAAALREEIARLHRMRDQAQGFDTAGLDPAHRFERDYLLALVDGDLFWLEQAEWPWRNPVFYGQALDPNVYLTRPYAPLAERMRAYVRWAQAVPQAATHVRANLRTPLPRAYVDIGRIRFGGLIPYVERDVPPIFATVTDTALQAAFRTATAGAVQALRELDAWLASERARGTDAFALGPDLFREMLRATERVDVPLERLEEIGRADLERNLRALEQACARYAGGGRSVQACVDRAAAHKPAGGAVAAARAQLDSLEQFVRARDLVAIPGTERAKVEESPPHQRWNFAYIDIPGPYEKGMPSVYYVAPPDPAWTPAEREAYIPGVADLLFTSVHEVWPGHFLQFLHSNRSPRMLGRVFVGYAFAEGWAHYTEELTWDAGLGEGDPETHIGQLLNALLRNARYLCAIGLHTKGMAVAECERLFREHAFASPAEARQQAARGTFDPAYLNYTLGKLMIMRLRDDWTRSRGGGEEWKPFHDAFLSYGGPPIPLVRQAMLGPAAGPPL